MFLLLNSSQNKGQHGKTKEGHMTNVNIAKS